MTLVKSVYFVVLNSFYNQSIYFSKKRETVTAYAIVLLPGLDGTGELFEPFVKCLPERINPIVVSYPRANRKTYEELKELVMPFIPEDMPFFLLGESFSGPLSVMISYEKPEGLKGLILCATFIRNPFILLPSWMRFISVSPVYRLWPALIGVRAGLSVEKFAPIAGLALKAIRSVNPSVIAHRVKSILSVNVERELSLCTCPVLYLMAGKDRLIRKHNYRRIKAVKNDVKLETIDTQHFILQLEPGRSSEILVDFMDSVIAETEKPLIKR